MTKRNSFADHPSQPEKNGWRTSSRSATSNCIEAKPLPDGIAVRDSKDSHGPELAFSAESWTNFVRTARSLGPLAVSYMQTA
jgi:hypothetical protein